MPEYNKHQKQRRASTNEHDHTPERNVEGAGQNTGTETLQENVPRKDMDRGESGASPQEGGLGEQSERAGGRGQGLTRRPSDDE